MKQPPQMNTPQIDLSSADDVICEACGNYTFQEVVLMKRISALISPSGREGIVPIPVFACNACGFINKGFLPVMSKAKPEPTSEPVSQLKLEL